jgi:hypothetical protein
MTQRDIARTVGVAQSTVSVWLANQKDITIEDGPFPSHRLLLGGKRRPLRHQHDRPLLRVHARGFLPAEEGGPTARRP